MQPQTVATLPVGQHGVVDDDALVGLDRRAYLVSDADMRPMPGSPR